MIRNTKPYTVSKNIWTNDDFETMSWHDNHVYAISFRENYELLMDIDYILQWIDPTEKACYYNFWVSPCTLVFENVHDLKINLEISEPFSLEIDCIYRSNPQRPINVDYIKCDREYQYE